MSAETTQDDEPHIAGGCLVWDDEDGTEFLPLREIKRWSVVGNVLDVFNDFTVTEGAADVSCNWWRIYSPSAPDLPPIPERVAAGCAWLDEVVPGWDRKIDLDQLNLASECRCILGQLAVDLLPPDADDETRAYAAVDGYGCWLDGDLSVPSPTDDDGLGFDRPYRGPTGADEYPALTAEWRRVILARRSAPEGSEAP